jgi:predicted dehydrogenase
MAKKTTRREFLRGATTATVGLTIGLPTIISARGQSKPRFAVVGVGGRGRNNLYSARDNGVVTALCDVDHAELTARLKEFPNAASFGDYRVMLERMHREFDAVVISTPDHNHAPAAALAMRYGKGVYVEKPLTRTVGEARALSQIAAENKVMSCMGNQGTASTNLRKVAKLVRQGSFGAVKAVHCWTNRAGGWWPQGVDRPFPTEECPPTVDWDVWLGPAPHRRYAKGYHPFAWRGWWDFGSGALGDIGCHCMNLPFMALDLRDPVSVVAQTSGHNRDSFPSWAIVTYEFGERNGRAPVTLKWYDGGKLPPEDLAPGVKLDVNGSLIVCEQATLYSPAEYGMSTQMIGGGAMPAVEVPESPGHFEEFARAVAGGPKPLGNIPDYSGPLTETVVLGNLAVWADGDKVAWDAKNVCVAGHAEYDDLVHPKYRMGWEL